MTALGDLIPAGLVHATAVYWPAQDAGVLLYGPSGSGKSDLALRLIDRGWQLVGDDQVFLSANKGTITASAPATLTNTIALSGLGLCRQMTMADGAAISHVVQLSGKAPRFPLDQGRQTVCGLTRPVIVIDGLAASAPIRVERFVEGVIK